MERKERTITNGHLGTGDPMSIRQIVALSGQRASGKSSIAKILEEEYDFERFAFSDVLREIAVLSGPKFVNDRNFLAQLGDVLRRYDEDFIVNSMRKKLKSTKNNVVIEDVRFPKEVDFCLERKVIMVSLVVEKSEQIRRIMRRDLCEHPVAEELIQHRDNFQLRDDIEWDMIVQSEGEFSEIAHNVVRYLREQTSA
jgi:cytidylate kinase